MITEKNHISDVHIATLIDWWKMGRKRLVVSILALHHPGLTAVLITQGAQDGTLNRSDCNEIANDLLENRRWQWQNPLEGVKQELRDGAERLRHFSRLIAAEDGPIPDESTTERVRELQAAANRWSLLS